MLPVINDNERRCVRACTDTSCHETEKYRKNLIIMVEERGGEGIGAGINECGFRGGREGVWKRTEVRRGLRRGRERTTKRRGRKRERRDWERRSAIYCRQSIGVASITQYMKNSVRRLSSLRDTQNISAAEADLMSVRLTVTETVVMSDAVAT